MKFSSLLLLIIGGVVLIAYSWIEKRINQKTCSECGFKISRDADAEECPRCEAKYPVSSYAKDF